MTVSDPHGVRLPVSAAQREIWLAQQLDPESLLYRIGGYTEINGPIDPVAFETVLRQAFTETESMRARFLEDDGTLWQTVEPLGDWTLPVFDVSGEAAPRAAAEAWMRAELAQPMNLARGPLFSHALLRLEPERFLWYQSYHHIVMDSFASVLLVRRVAALY
ncbi:condensation domain-containing protein, partial [Frankia sp. CiP1_Cm_nod2]|uniref:condensation domain-containing protein n=1 Tax=Frankia sp. CiP1_Cm_nod2 TaxID=2897161 RepID=UPI00202488FB